MRLTETERLEWCKAAMAGAKKIRWPMSLDPAVSADDLRQEAATRALDAASSGATPQNVITWCSTLGRNDALMQIRKCKRLPPRASDWRSEAAEARAQFEPWDSERLNWAIGRLAEMPEIDRDAFEARFGCSPNSITVRDVAAKWNKSETWIRCLARKVKEQLQELAKKEMLI